MIKLLVVDDNDFERNALANYINWDILGIQLADTACNGQDAVEKARLHKPEIIISDIKMPVMNGIEMAKAIKSFNPETKFIFSSGYDDVALLKEALEIRAYNYIIKPLNPDELIDTVKKVISVIIDERLSNMESNTIIKQHKDNLPFLQSKFFENLILNERNSYDINEITNQLNNLKLRITGNYKLVLMDLDFENDDIFEISLRTNSVIAELRGICIEENVILLRIEHNKITAILYRLDDKGSKAEKIISSLVEKLNAIKSRYFFKFTIGVSTMTANLTGLNILFKQCNGAVSKKVELGYGHVVYYEENDNRTEGLKDENKDRIKELIEKVAAGIFDGESFEEEINALMEAAAAMPGSKLENIKSVLISLLNSISKHMESNRESFDEVAGDELDVCSYIIGAKIIPDILQYARQILSGISSYYARNKSSKDDYIVSEILKILDNEYSKPITLTYLSDRVYLSPNYLRILFKNKMNISIQDYLTNKRINKAKDLLKQNCYKVHEIGEMVGYANSTYFNIVFKNKVNLTPGEYRSKFFSSQITRDISQ